MKVSIRSLLNLALLSIVLATAGGCASTESYSDPGGITSPKPDPMTQQIRRQEAMSKVTRSITPSF